MKKSFKKVISDITLGCIEECPHGSYPCEYCKTCYTGKLALEYADIIADCDKKLTALGLKVR